jgi:hypothetical protein
LLADSPERLRRFQAFVESTLQQELDRATATFGAALLSLENLHVSDETTGATIEELRVEDEELATTLEHRMRAAEDCRSEITRSLKANLPHPDNLPVVDLDSSAVTRHGQTLRSRAARVLEGANADTKERLAKELAQLEAREILGRSLDAVLREIERKKRLAAYQLCLRDTSTRGITQKSSEVTKAAVTGRLASSFQGELRRLRFRHLEVELCEVGGERGALYHKLVLKRAAGVELPRVVSEGEARTLSIAAFFAELSTAAAKGAILFDDPVSSLDHVWRENVACRLAEESKTRQVIVFTHDIAFLVALVSCAKECGASCNHQYLRREAAGAGVSSPDLPWVAMKVGERIGVLKNLWQGAEKLHRTAPRERYEQEAMFIYGRLREAWERALEEVMLNGVVERYRRSIQTQQVRHLSDITVQDCEALEAGIAKCSRCLAGHDHAGAENPSIPDPTELQDDIAALEHWAQAIRQRRR